MTKINSIIEGRFKNSGICNYKEYIGTPGTKFTKDIIVSYQVIDETNKDQYHNRTLLYMQKYIVKASE